MLASARDYIERAWWVVNLPGLTILLSVLAINLMGDGLRDALDALNSQAVSVDYAVSADFQFHQRIALATVPGSTVLRTTTVWRVYAKAEEAQGCSVEDRRGETQGGLHDQRGHAVGQHGDKHQARQAGTGQAGSGYIVAVQWF